MAEDLPDPAEWDFSPSRVSRSELEACFIYEYARELLEQDSDAKAAMADWASQATSPTYDDIYWLPPILLQRFERWFVLPIAIHPSFFPATPFQSIEKEIRKLYRYEKSTGILRPYIFDDFPTVMTAWRVDSDGPFSVEKRLIDAELQKIQVEWEAPTDVAVLLTAIDLQHRDSDIIREFERQLWLLRLRNRGRLGGSRSVEEHPEYNVATFARAYLNHLGSERAQRKYEISQMLKPDGQTLKPGYAPDSQKNDFYANALAARKLISRIRNGWSGGEVDSKDGT